ncbi:MAG: six-hairpin glycosidase, partial [Porphyromonadaceae bacterium]|nr:six-hairpin glycosidase [Porphyromonadaceae bacterium]
PDGKLWVTYSMNKEDIWVASVPVPVKISATAHADGSFSKYGNLADMTDWNIYSPLWAPVSLEGEWLVLSDKDPYDYARVEKVIPATKNLTVDFDVRAAQNSYGQLNIEFLDDRGNMCTRIVMDSLVTFKVKSGARYSSILKNYKPDQTYHITVKLSVDGHVGIYYVDGGKGSSKMFDTPVEAITRIVFRTGDLFDKPDMETPADQTEDMPRADEEDPMATFYIANFKTASSDADAMSAVLKYNDYADYVDYFNKMEEENIVTDIPNSESSEWMRKNIPLFDCPDKDFEEIYYYRWWSLRKHIKHTPVGYGMTEFLIPRSYADKYNLIACAIGHHIMETRWLRDTTYLHQILNTWYHGNSGKAMEKMTKFSSWNPAAVYEAYKVLENKEFLLSLKPSLEEEYAYWKGSHRLDNGLYWQSDVQDGMEESISGGRRKHYARPTINSYMYGNARALSVVNALAGEEDKVREYDQDADDLKSLIETKLWNEEQTFFETLRGDTLATVREAIGFIPWYFDLPDEGKYDEAWKQVNDEKGFSAPYGLTTAERDHPEFRTHGTGRCEWDGAVWPFATSQTLTAMANYLNDYSSPILTSDTFFKQMKIYVESQHYRGRPYIGEYLDESNGAWLMGDRERSRYYNHSTFADLVITGIVGLRPQADGTVVVNPLIPEGIWDYFCLDNVSYHGNVLTILYDKEGQKYHQGKGLILFVNGKQVAKREGIGKLIYRESDK